MAVDEVVKEAKSKMDKAMDVLGQDLKSFRTGRASTGLVENIRVDYYGNPTPLKQLASLAAPQSDSIVIKPFDPGSLKDIEKAIKNSDLSIAPIVDGKVVRLNIPPLSEERRESLTEKAKQTGEQTKISIRNIRRDANKQLETQEKDSEITEDDLDMGKKKIDDLTRQHTEEVDKMVQQKSEEIMSG
jgi:ribosome recycling factor